MDVDAIAARTIASLAVERAKQVPDLTRAWLSMKDKKEWVTYAFLGKK